MKLITLNTKRGFVNLFADYIITHLGLFDEISLIQVTDCINFLVVGGQTTHKEILNLTELKNKFSFQFKNMFSSIEIDKLNIIDIVEYNKEPTDQNVQYFGPFFNSDRPIYHHNQLSPILKHYSYNDYNITDNIIFSRMGYFNSLNTIPEPYHISSEFPHGYSMNNNRNKLYYLEYVSYNLIEIQGITILSYNWASDVSLLTDSLEKTVDSIMKDVFDFDLKSFSNRIKDYDILQDLISPKSEKPWLIKDKVRDLFIL